MWKALRPLVPLAVFLCATGTTPALRGQLPKPRLQSVFPPGGQAGESVEVTLTGSDLEGLDTLWFDHPGLRGFRIKDRVFRIAIAPGTPLGHHDLRGVGTYGITNPRTFVVGDRPERTEAEPNQQLSQANPLPVNSAIDGQITGPPDFDTFAFEGRKGQRIFLGLEAGRIDSRLDATLRVLNSRGTEIAESQDVYGTDPFLDLTLPEDGRYYVRIHDVLYRGSGDHFYRLTLHDGPHLDAVVPLAAKPGVETTFTVYGRNLGGQTTAGPAVDGHPLESKEVRWTLPTDPEALAPPGVGFVPSAAALRRGADFRIAGPSGMSNPVFIAASDGPVLLENEPNDEAKQAQALTLPCDLTGSFAAPNDFDVYRFRAKEGEVWWVEVTAQQLGSPADPSFVLQKVPAKGDPLDIANGDDQADRSPGRDRMPSASVDASRRWKVAESGLYQLVVQDLYGSQRGDPRLTYRLRIRAEKPDFRVFLLPRVPNQLDAVTVPAGGRAVASLVAWRLDGFTSRIRVEARDLPTGVTCDPVVLGPNQPQAPIVFTAAEDAHPGTGLVTLVASSRWADKKDSLDFVPGVTVLGPDLTHEVQAASLVWPPSNPTAPTVRMTRGFPVAITSPAPFTVVASPSRWVVPQGHQLDLEVGVVRRDGFNGPVALNAVELVPNTQVANATVAKDAKSTTLPLFVPKNTPVGTYTLLLQGTAPVPFSKDPKAKQKPNVNVAAPANTVSINVQPAPLRPAVNAKDGKLAQGGKIEVGVTLNRQGSFRGPVMVSLRTPAAAKLSAEPVSVTPGANTAQLVVQAAPDSPVGRVANAVVRLTATVRGETVEVDEPLNLTIGKK